MLPESVTKFKGCTEVRIFDVEKGAIRRYAEAVEDANPLYWNAEYARNSRYGSIIAPPGFWGWLPNDPSDIPFGSQGGSQRFIARQELTTAFTEAGFGRVLDGGHTYEFFKPVRAGDTLTAVYKILDITEKEGKSGKFAVMWQETRYTNQHGELVAIWRQHVLHRERE
jgi:acyl dehydratase